VKALGIRSNKSRLGTLERIALLFDRESFVELSPGEESSAMTGYGLIDGRKTYLIADTPYAEVPNDFATLHAKKISLLKEIEKDPHPLVLLADAFRIHPPKGNFIATPGFPEFLMGKGSATAYMRELGKLSGVVPIVATLVGDSWAGGTVPPALCDTYVLIKKYRMTFARPELYLRMTGDHGGLGELGSAEMHCTESGLGDALVETEQDALAWIKRYLSYFPASYQALSPTAPPDRCLPPSQEKIESFNIEPRRSFDARKLIDCFVDRDSFLELKEGYANEVATGLARVNGRAVGIVGHNTMNKFGAIYPSSCKKIAKFVTLCDSFSIPLIFLADTPGFMIGVGFDEEGAIKTAALVCATLAKTTVPKSLVIVRNAFGGGLFTTGPGFADSVVAFPDAKIGPFGSVTIRPAESAEEAQGFRDMMDMAEMSRLLERGLLDRIVDQRSLRSYLVDFLEKNQPGPRSAPKGVLCI
jgi:acetyl-CoA carboxylase carboxyltransferase component